MSYTKITWSTSVITDALYFHLANRVVPHQADLIRVTLSGSALFAKVFKGVSMR